ncbi:uncharacterized protein LOC112178043 isoform X2 [Rosa chinensis]|uniref:uncharacterized protein LOC112178043 isoform X2 n=1 Tax=Rosa chinensis TaxID=74649 RepID=UPI001AD8CB44|nr:uncharacterized protein LOC112178043 isoform X2 [Rosa chinensis]
MAMRRRYQLELCKKALEENIILYLETSYGKTHIAMSLMYEPVDTQTSEEHMCVLSPGDCCSIYGSNCSQWIIGMEILKPEMFLKKMEREVRRRGRGRGD